MPLAPAGARARLSRPSRYAAENNAAGEKVCRWCRADASNRGVLSLQSPFAAALKISVTQGNLRIDNPSP